MSGDDDFVNFLLGKKFIMDETGYLYKKIGDSWLNCDCGMRNFHRSDMYYVITISDSEGEDIYTKRYYDFDEFRQSIIRVIREERFKTLLDE